MRQCFVWLVAAMVAMVSWVTPAIAADVEQGATVFTNNCAACHIGGGNVVNAAKTLKQSDLETYEMNSIEKIVYQVNNGKMAMPAFKGRLSDEQIESVAMYVLSQAEKDW